MTIPSADEDLVHNLYAHFGLTYFKSECLYRELANLCAIVAFPDPQLATSTRFEEEFRRSFALTLGQLIERVRGHINPRHHEALATALRERNFIAHTFWYERAHLMFSDGGVRTLIDELEAIGDRFLALDQAITAESRHHYEALGITAEKLEELTLEVAQGRPYEPLPSERYPRKAERIVAAWLVPAGTKLVTPILQSEDGTLWQLTDVGLGWCGHAVPEAGWPAFVELQNLLPADVNPRPPIIGPWNYDLLFAGSTTLQVRRGPDGALTYRLKRIVAV